MQFPDLIQINHPPALPPRPADGHKGLFGKVLVVGGSAAMLGAPVLAATAALRLGSGLVQIAIPEAMVPFALSLTPELISLPLPESPARALLADAAEKSDVLVVGPGMGKSKAARGRIRRLIRMDKPAVLDADALNLLAEEKAWPAEFKLRAVLTPHPGEMARLTKLLPTSTADDVKKSEDGKKPLDPKKPESSKDLAGKTRPERKVPSDEAGRIDLAVTAARAFGQVILLKGHRTVVTDGSRVYVNQTGDSSLSKAGAGDVLSGMIGSLIGQEMEPFEAACLGAYLHGKAGEIAGKRLGMRSVLARDVIEAISEALAG